MRHGGLGRVESESAGHAGTSPAPRPTVTAPAVGPVGRRSRQREQAGPRRDAMLGGDPRVGRGDQRVAVDAGDGPDDHDRAARGRRSTSTRSMRRGVADRRSERRRWPPTVGRHLVEHPARPAGPVGAGRAPARRRSQSPSRCRSSRLSSRRSPTPHAAEAVQLDRDRVVELVVDVAEADLRVAGGGTPSSGAARTDEVIELDRRAPSAAPAAWSRNGQLRPSSRFRVCPHERPAPSRAVTSKLHGVVGDESTCARSCGRRTVCSGWSITTWSRARPDIGARGGVDDVEELADRHRTAARRAFVRSSRPL